MTNGEQTYTTLGKILIFIASLGLVAGGIGGFIYFKSQKEKMKRRPPKQQAAMVEIMTMMPNNYPSIVLAMGTVVPDKQVVLKSKVTGEIVSISDAFVQGGLMKKGQILLTIDDSDYQIEVKKADSALSKALSDFEIEKGNQMIAVEELKLINEANVGDIKATDLSMRKPQLVQARAAVDSARADLERAKLNLSRTRVVLPFNAMILEKNVNLGSLVSAQGALATIVGVDVYQVEALVPPDKLGVLKISETSGSSAEVHSQYSNQTWQGKVVRTTGQMADNSRMAGVIVQVQDPLGLMQPEKTGQLLLGDHVALKMIGRDLNNVFKLPRAFLRDEDTIWIYRDGKLDIKPVTLAWKEDGVVYVDSGIEPGDQVIVSELAAPVRGMALQKAEEKQP